MRRGERDSSTGRAGPGPNPPPGRGGVTQRRRPRPGSRARDRHPRSQSTGSDREGETAAKPRSKKYKRGGRAPQPTPDHRKANRREDREERGALSDGGVGRSGGGGRVAMSGESVRHARVWCLLAPSRGGVPPLGDTHKRRTNPRRPVFTLRPLPCERAPPGLGLSCPQPDPDHPARWVRFLAPRPWM